MRIYSKHMDGEKFMGNTITKIFHDLDKEKPLCNIDSIIDSGNEIAFSTLKKAESAGFTQCEYCCKLVNETNNNLVNR